MLLRKQLSSSNVQWASWVGIFSEFVFGRVWNVYTKVGSMALTSDVKMIYGSTPDSASLNI